MSPNERDELLIRVDVRTEALEKWAKEHTEQHQINHSNIVKLFLACLTVAGGALIKAFL